MPRLKQLLLFAIAFALWTAPTARLLADEPADDPLAVCKTDLTKEQLANPPEREIKVERSAEPHMLRLKNADPAWIEQKYFATLQLKLPENAQQTHIQHDKTGRLQKSASIERPRPSEILKSDKFDLLQKFPTSQYLIAPYANSGDYESLAVKFQRWIDNTPEDRRPGKEEMNYFVASPLPFLSNHNLITKDGYLEIRIPATTPELAERRAQAFLVLLDNGFSRELQLALWDQLQSNCEALASLEKERTTNAQEAETIEQETGRFADFSPDMLLNLRVQELQLEVDTAGVKARLAICEKLLAKPALPAARQAQLTDMQLAAEVEATGLEARQAKLAELVGKVKSKTALLGKSEQVRRSLVLARIESDKAANKIAEIKSELSWFAPLPLIDDKIVIQPLEWIK